MANLRKAAWIEFWALESGNGSKEAKEALLRALVRDSLDQLEEIDYDDSEKDQSRDRLV